MPYHPLVAEVASQLQLARAKAKPQDQKAGWRSEYSSSLRFCNFLDHAERKLRYLACLCSPGFYAQEDFHEQEFNILVDLFFVLECVL